VRYRGYLEHTESGRRMELYTNQPAVQVYSANFLEDDGNRLKGGLIKSKQIALCLETQCMPDSMNHENFTPCTLDVGEVYDYTTIFKFVNQ
jgi:aldose 1-epimerase